MKTAEEIEILLEKKKISILIWKEWGATRGLVRKEKKTGRLFVFIELIEFENVESS